MPLNNQKPSMSSCTVRYGRQVLVGDHLLVVKKHTRFSLQLYITYYLGVGSGYGVDGFQPVVWKKYSTANFTLSRVHHNFLTIESLYLHYISYHLVLYYGAELLSVRYPAHPTTPWQVYFSFYNTSLLCTQHQGHFQIITSNTWNFFFFF